jgi:hypothetical protein
MLTDQISAASQAALSSLFTTRVPANGMHPTNEPAFSVCTSYLLSRWYFRHEHRGVTVATFLSFQQVIVNFLYANDDEPTLLFRPLAPQGVCNITFSS